MKIAVIGTGISGMVAAYLLNDDHDLTIYEANDYVGGHTHTVDVPDPGGRTPVDTGFIVYNDWTYPNFVKLLERLEVPTQPSDMSFSVRCEDSGLEYQGNSLTTLFAQRRNLLSPSFYRMLRDVVRFYRQSRELLASDGPELTIGQYLQRRKYSQEFIEQHLVPVGAAIWSSDPRQFFDFPARYLIRFFKNHGMLNLLHRPRWRVVSGGARVYVDALTAAYRDRIRLRTPIEAVRRTTDFAEVTPVHGPAERFDAVIIATHSDQALRMLGDDATSEERAVLGAMQYQPNDTVLHSDPSLLPQRRKCWASWNYHIPAEETRAATLTYNMNMLQSLPTQHTYCVTLNRTEAIAPDRIIGRYGYEHPVYTVASVNAQRRHQEINGVRRTWFCGAYWGFGFHEDGVNSALTVCRDFGKEL